MAARSSSDEIRERENGSMKGRDELKQKISESQNGQKLSHVYKCFWGWVNEVQEQNDEIIRIFHHRKMRKFPPEPGIGNQVIVIGHLPAPRELPPPPQPSPAVAFFLVWSRRSRPSSAEHLCPGSHHGQMEFLPPCQEFGCYRRRIVTQGGWGLSFYLDGHQH